MPYLVTPDGTPLFFIDEGPRANAAIILIHAEPFSVKFWKYNIPPLARHFRVVAYDLRGRGNSGKCDFGHSIAEYARDLRFVIESLGLQRAIVVGWSLGGSVLWSYVEQFGHARLVGNVNVDQPPYRFISSEHLANRLHSIRTRRLAHHKEAVLSYFGPEASHDDVVIDWMAYECMKTPTLSHLAIVTDSYHSDFRSHMPRIIMPTQIHWSRYGSITADVAEIMHRNTQNSRLIYYESAGHLIPWVEAEKFNSQLISFAGGLLK